jgi:4-amino-4-deoxy-L-arabinose transferase-like glycosyltransferase
MTQKTGSEILWGAQAKVIYLLLGAGFMLLMMLGGKEIWTQEHRWADIVSGMFYRHDFLHPYLGNADYYDKPLLSYWLIAGLTVISGKLSLWALRLPSALAGILAVWSLYRIGTLLQSKALGLLSGWLMLTTFYFIFWGKTSSADMLNLGGTLFAVSWYFEKRARPGFLNYAVFFMIVALTSLCKGLVGAVVPVLVILPDLLRQQEWKKHLRLSFLLAMVPALIVYILPFWASSHYSTTNYGENGLYLVYRENFLRYFQPFDHKGPIWTYFVWLPMYLMPWVIFFIPALFTLPARWKNLSPNSKWIVWSVLVLFIFFTLSGSRRNYYILPLVPFAILLSADWILSAAHRSVWAGRLVIASFILLFLNFDVIQPAFYADGGMKGFAAAMHTALAGKDLSTYNVVLLDPESKVRFYLHLPAEVKDFPISGGRNHQTEASLLQAWPVLQEKQSDVIYISRKSYEPQLKNLLPGYAIVEAPPSFGERFLKMKNPNAPVAFVGHA